LYHTRTENSYRLCRHSPEGNTPGALGAEPSPTTTHRGAHYGLFRGLLTMLGLLVMLALLGLVWARLVRSDKPLSRSIGDVGWGMFRRMLEYKCAWYGARLILAPRDFSSTRLCSRCGWIGPRLPLS